MTCPGFSACRTWGDDRPREGAGEMPAAKPEEFRRRVVELVRLWEKPVSQVAKDLGMSLSELRS